MTSWSDTVFKVKSYTSCCCQRHLFTFKINLLNPDNSSRITCFNTNYLRTLGHAHFFKIKIWPSCLHLFSSIKRLLINFICHLCNILRCFFSVQQSKYSYSLLSFYTKKLPFRIYPTRGKSYMQCLLNVLSIFNTTSEFYRKRDRDSCCIKLGYSGTSFFLSRVSYLYKARHRWVSKHIYYFHILDLRRNIPYPRKYPSTSLATITP